MEELKICIDGQCFTIRFMEDGQVLVNGTLHRFTCFGRNGGLYNISVDERCHTASVHQLNETRYEIWMNSDGFAVSVESEKERLLADAKTYLQTKTSLIKVCSPMPGLITKIEVTPGQIVENGQGLIILEAMKMENEIRSTAQALVKSIEVKEKTTVEKDEHLMTLEILPVE